MRKITLEIEPKLPKASAPVEDIKLGIENYGRFYGIYRAKIVEVNEKEQTIKVEIPDIPIAAKNGIVIDYISSRVYPFAGENSGVYFEPKEGDYLWIAFESGLLTYPVVLGWFHGYQINKKPEGIKYGFVSRLGDKIYVDEDGKKISIEHHSKKVKIDIEEAKINITIDKGEINIKTDGTVNIQGEKINTYKSDAKYKAVLGDELVKFLDALLKLLARHAHPPNAPPAQAGDFLAKIQELNNLLSKIVSLE